MQLLGGKSEEGWGTGLGLLNYDTVLIGKASERSAPVMGWMTPKILRSGWLGVDPGSRYYFMHDYGVLDAPRDVLTMTHEVSGTLIASSVAQGKIVGFQFHPERSLKFGQQILASAVRELNR
jgi:glutamine amidotransferase